MADQPTRKDFEKLTKAQQETNKLLQAQAKVDAESNTKAASFTTNFGEIVTELRGQLKEGEYSKLAKEEADQTQDVIQKTQAAEKVRDDEQTRLLKGLVSNGQTNASAEQENLNETNISTKKQGKLLERIAKGMSGLNEWTKSKIKGLREGKLGKILRGTLYASFLLGLLVFLNSPLWDKFRGWLAEGLVKFKDFLVNLDWKGIQEKIDKVKKAFCDIFDGISGLAAALGVLALFLLLPGGLFTVGLIGGGVLAYFFMDEIKAGIQLIKDIFCNINVELKSWEAALMLVITSLAGGLLAIKGLGKMLGKAFGFSAKGVTAASVAAGTGTRAFTPSTMFKKGQVVDLGKQGKAVWQGQSFARYTGDVKPGKIAKNLTAKTGLGAQISNDLVKDTLKGGGGKGFQRIMRFVNILGKLHPALKGGIAGGILLSSFLSNRDDEGGMEGAVEEVLGLAGGMGTAYLGALLGGMVGLAGGPLAFFGAIAGGLGGWFAGEAIIKGIAQFLMDKPITAFSLPAMVGGEYINDMLNGKKVDPTVMGNIVGGVDGSTMTDVEAGLSSDGYGTQGKNIGPPRPAGIHPGGLTDRILKWFGNIGELPGGHIHRQNLNRAETNREADKLIDALINDDQTSIIPSALGNYAVLATLRSIDGKIGQGNFFSAPSQINQTDQSVNLVASTVSLKDNYKYQYVG